MILAFVTIQAIVGVSLKILKK
nr:unnamed protein product [Callosobruchus analis]